MGELHQTMTVSIVRCRLVVACIAARLPGGYCGFETCGMHAVGFRVEANENYQTWVAWDYEGALEVEAKRAHLPLD